MKKKSIAKAAGTFLLCCLLCGFSGIKKPIRIQDWRLVHYEKNSKGEIVAIQYEKVGKPYIMRDSSLYKTIHTIEK